MGLSVRSPVVTVAVQTPQGRLTAPLDAPVRLQFRLVGPVGRRSNPQCVTWEAEGDR